eukprot:1195285-Amphidinium_carterae.1
MKAVPCSWRFRRSSSLSRHPVPNPESGKRELERLGPCIDRGMARHRCSRQASCQPAIYSAHRALCPQMMAYPAFWMIERHR